jgi:hypothetical protein
MADWKDLPEGYYAVPDPRPGVEEITYWRVRAGSFGPWPKKARYGPTLTRSDLPEGMDPRSEECRAFADRWFDETKEPYDAAIVRAISADPIAAKHRFSDFQVRCCDCGRKLTNDLSKVYGIGPECRKGLPDAVLANYYRRDVSHAHAMHEAAST